VDGYSKYDVKMPDKYDVDYSKFDNISDSDDEIEEVYSPAALKREPPPQLQQAMRMMKLGKDSGNPELLQRAEKLAKEAMALDPTLRQNFDKVAKMHAAGMDPKDIPAAFTEVSGDDSMDASIGKANSVSSQISELKKQMEDQLAALKRSEDELNGKTNSLEGLAERQNPDELQAFLKNEGLSEEDIHEALQAAENGDEDAAKNIFAKLSGGADDPEDGDVLDKVEKMTTAVNFANSIDETQLVTKRQPMSKGKSKKSKQQIALEEQKAKLMEMQHSLMEQTKGAAAKAAKAEAELAAAQEAMGKASANVDAAAGKIKPEDIEENIEGLKQGLKGEGWGGGFLGKGKLKEREEKTKERKAKEAKESETKKKEAESARRAQVQARVQAALAGRAAPAPAAKQEKLTSTSAAANAPSSTSSASDVVPTYTLKRLVSGAVRAVVSLPELDSMQGLELDISEHELSLSSTASAKHSYRLKIKFEQSINREGVKAKFKKDAKELRITLPSQQQ
jgi:hypothetical protein